MQPLSNIQRTRTPRRRPDWLAVSLFFAYGAVVVAVLVLVLAIAGETDAALSLGAACLALILGAVVLVSLR
jgi:hypothetical protein